MFRPSLTVPSTVRLAASALAALSLFGAFAYQSDQPANPQIQLADSGHEAPQPTFQKPDVAEMKLGVTETTTTPGEVPSVEKAVPGS